MVFHCRRAARVVLSKVICTMRGASGITVGVEKNRLNHDNDEPQKLLELGIYPTYPHPPNGGEVDQTGRIQNGCGP